MSCTRCGYADGDHASWCWRAQAEPGDAHAPVDDVRPVRSSSGITRGLLELPTCSVSVLVTRNDKGEHVASALLWRKADETPRAEVFRRGSRRAAWEALSAWVAEVIA